MIDRRVVQLGCVDPTSWDRVLSLLFDFVYSRSKGPIIFMNSCFSYYFYVYQSVLFCFALETFD